MNVFINQSISLLPKTSHLTIKRMMKLKILTYWDLINYYPVRYVDYSKKVKISDIYSKKINFVSSLEDKERVTIEGNVKKVSQIKPNYSLSIQKIVVDDKTGEIEVIFYNQPYILTTLGTAKEVYVSGYLDNKSRPKLIAEEYDILNNLQNTIHTGRIIPIYSQTYGLSSKTIRSKVSFLLDVFSNQKDEILPPFIIKKFELMKLKDAYYNIHFPSSWIQYQKAKSRLSFNEMFFIHLTASMIKKRWQKQKVTHKLQVDKHQSKINNFIKKLPFTLTKSQGRTTQEILNDLQAINPMNRLLQGDVGCGKTVVAAIASYGVFLNKYKTIIMAPTEILAQQHAVSIKKLFNLQKGVCANIVLITRSNKPTKDELKNADIIIGTHALIQDKVIYDKIGLVVIDEQHKFGVTQRALLKQKGYNCHLLTMTATPIPRTVTLVLYGYLEISVIDELPKGRIPIKTYLVPSHKRQDAYEWIKSEIRKNKTQAFIVCPLIEESEVETLKTVKAVTKEYEFLRKNVFSNNKLGLLYGRMKPQDKQSIMSKFNRNNFDILVTTPVVEVGVDIRNASIIVIEEAQRFGLAQLHQLRGRVGRNDRQAYCLLFNGSTEKKTSQRLSQFAKITSGFKLAELDLKYRGGGQIFGMLQHGRTELKIANFSDHKLIKNINTAITMLEISGFHINNNSPLMKILDTYKVDDISKD